MKDMGALVTDIFFDFHDRNIIYVCSRHLYRSRDCGVTWDTLTSDAVQGPLPSKPTDDPNFPFRMTLDKDNTSSIWCAFGAPSMHPDYTSLSSFKYTTDGGATWKNSQGIPSGISVVAIHADYNSPVSSRRILATTGRGVYCSEDGGRTFSILTNGIPAGQITGSALAIDTAGRRTVVYAATVSALYKSSDGGRSWNRLYGPSSGYQEIRTGLFDPNTVYVLCNHDEICKSIDGGKSWNKQLGDRSNCSGDWKSEAVGWSFERNMWSIGVSPVAPGRAIWTDFFRLYKTENGGEWWQEIFSNNESNRRWSSRGLEVTTCYGYHIDPLNPSRHYISCTDNGFFRSVDTGKTWTYANTGSNWNTFYWCAIDPQNTSILYAAVSSLHDLPQPWHSGQRSSGAVVMSTDAGKSWIYRSAGLPGQSVTCVIIDPQSNAGSRTLYAATWGTGVYKSIDGGSSWSEKNNGITGSKQAWRIILDRGVLYLVTVRDKPADLNGSVFKSTDGAATWIRLDNTIDFKEPTDIAVHPGNPDILYVANRLTHTAGILDTIPGGVYRSVNGGAAWERVLRRNYPFGLTVDPHNKDRIYVTLCEDGWEESKGICVSNDRGATWESITDIPFRFCYRVNLSPSDNRTLYVTTFGGGVLKTTIPSGITPAAAPFLSHPIQNIDGKIIAIPIAAHKIRYTIRETGSYTIALFDVQGRLVSRLFEGMRREGTYTVHPGVSSGWETGAEGLYYLHIEKTN